MCEYLYIHIIHTHILGQQQSTSGEDRTKMARMERKVKKAEEVMAAAERSQVYVSLSLYVCVYVYI